MRFELLIRCAELRTIEFQDNGLFYLQRQINNLDGLKITSRLHES